MKRAYVFGSKGRSGKAAAALLTRAGWDVTELDGADAWPAGADPDLCVTAPGVPPTHPWRTTAAAHGVPVISELQLGVEHWREKGGRLLAVTGSKGKSSVVKAVADALGGVACGNYGTPLCEVVLDRAEGPLPWAVVEVSSFQLETTMLPPDAFEAAVVLNLQEDHLDRHGSVEAYHALKRKLLGMAKRAYAPEDLVSRAADAEWFRGTYFDNPTLMPNGVGAVALMRAAGLDDAAVSAAFRSFEPLPHRFETVYERDGVVWIDDSKATSIAALAAGVGMAQSKGLRVRLVAGGLAKGDDPREACGVLSSAVEKVYLIGASADVFAAAWRGTVPCEICGTLEAAVAEACREARAGEAVLLSPGTASFDQFKNFEERGDRFAALAKRG